MPDDETLELFKSKNDWNRELDESKMTVVPNGFAETWLNDDGDSINFDFLFALEVYKEKFDISDNTKYCYYSFSVCPEGQMWIIREYEKTDEGPVFGNCRLVFFDWDCNIIDSRLLESKPYACNDEIHEFKQKFSSEWGKYPTSDKTE